MVRVWESVPINFTRPALSNVKHISDETLACKAPLDETHEDASQHGLQRSSTSGKQGARRSTGASSTLARKKSVCTVRGAVVDALNAALVQGTAWDPFQRERRPQSCIVPDVMQQSPVALWAKYVEVNVSQCFQVRVEVVVS